MTKVLGDVSFEAARLQLERIISSKSFAASDRNRRFLAFVVGETLEGREERIKAYTIATQVFGRSESFDPQTDSIVRIEAGRLRRALERYYLTAGREDRIRIELPRGSYIPAFSYAPPALQISGRRGEKKAGPKTILVSKFDTEGDNAGFPNFERGFMRAVIVALTRFSHLRVYGPPDVFDGAEVPTESDRPRSDNVDYILSGGLAFMSAGIQIDMVLVDGATGLSVWAESFSEQPSAGNLLIVRNQIANQVARTIAQPYGVIHRAADRAPTTQTVEAPDPDQSVLEFYRYWRTFDRTMLAKVRRDLELVVANNPTHGDAVACLSLLTIDAYRFARPNDPSALNDHASGISLARRAVELNPGSSVAHYALGLAHWFCGHFALGIEFLEQGRTLNPNDGIILADLGQRYAMLGDWKRAVPLLDTAYRLNPTQPGTYRIGLFLYHYAEGRYEKALDEAQKVGAPQVIYEHVATAAAAAELGCMELAGIAIGRIQAIDPHYEDRIAADLGGRGLSLDLTRKLIASLAKAGMMCPCT